MAPESLEPTPLHSLRALQPGERMWPDAGGVHLWYVFQDELQDRELLARYAALMTAEERVRHDRFVFARDRHQYLVTRALVRTTLSRYAPVAPADWRFTHNAHGKPAIAVAATAERVAAGADERPWPQLLFNLSNTRGLIACAVAWGCEAVGVDVEDEARKGATVEIADRFFSPEEAASLRALPAARQAQGFFAYWTLKESYIKARGVGLSMPLDQFTLHLDAGQGIRISFGAGVEDEPGAWQFELVRMSACHLLGLAVRRRPGQVVSVAAAPCVPLRG